MRGSLMHIVDRTETSHTSHPKTWRGGAEIMVWEYFSLLRHRDQDRVVLAVILGLWVECCGVV